jgi:hypothetical protein
MSGYQVFAASHPVTKPTANVMISTAPIKKPSNILPSTPLYAASR